MVKKTKGSEHKKDNMQEAVSEHSEQKDVSAASSETESPEPAVVELHSEEQKGAESAVRELETKLAEMNERYIRLLAEYDNYRKRTARDMENIVKYAAEKLMLQILPVLDDLDRATEHKKNDKINYEDYINGIALIEERLRKILAAAGLEPIEAVGKPFDPDYHEAILQIESDNHDSGTVTGESEKGYMLSGKVIRYSKVIVSR